MARNDAEKSSMFEGEHMDLARERDQQRYKFNQAITGVDLSDTQLAGVDPHNLNKAAFNRVLNAVVNEKVLDRMPDSADMNTRNDTVIFQARYGKDADDPSVARYCLDLNMWKHDAEQLGIQSRHERDLFDKSLESKELQAAQMTQEREAQANLRQDQRMQGEQPGVLGMGSRV